MPGRGLRVSLIAKVLVDVSLDREFDYAIPPALERRVAIGMRVRVPFGPRETEGYVVGLADRSEFDRLKPIRGVLDESPVLTEAILSLARWISEYYCAPIESAVRTVLPGAVRRAESRHLARLFVTPVSSSGEANAPAAARRQAEALALVRSSGGMFLADLVRTLRTTPETIRALERRGLVAIVPEVQARDPYGDVTRIPTGPLELMPQQAAALEMVTRSMDTGAPPVILLYGVTGSGKTEVYLQAIDHALKQGRGAIVLVPEIALTPQTVERFHGRFGRDIAVLHSHLSDGERHDEWHRIRGGKARIVIGARSAVFAPVRDLGLIVVDEEHEPTYKQEEVPRYNARDVAVMRGRMERCAVLLGSATPSLESYWNAKIGKYALAAMPSRVDHRRMPAMRVLDMRAEAEQSGRVSIFSKDLIEAIRTRIERGEQTMLFLNRRGYATSLVCPKCGYVAACDQCSVSYTYHRHGEQLRCHTCGKALSVPPRCPGCADPSFKFSGAGTQRVEIVLQTLLPKARIQRLDADVATRKHAYRDILGDFRTGKIDVLIGTQMIAKGLHFPNVTLIGIIRADSSLHMPDFRAAERTFQLLTQVAGRAGRGDVSGLVIVQTYTPFHPAVQAARRLDLEGFFDQELEFRKELQYPPFTHLLCVTFRGESEERVASSADALAKSLSPKLPSGVVLAGPSPAPLARAHGLYRYQLVIRAPSARSVTVPLRDVVREMKWPAGVAVSIDVDAVSLM